MTGDHAAVNGDRDNMAAATTAQTPQSPTPLLEFRDLEVRFPAGRREALALDKVSFSVSPGEIFGLMGETGAGKSLTASAALDLIPPPGRVTGGSLPSLP